MPAQRGLPSVSTAHTTRPHARRARRRARALRRASSALNIVGGCCGTTPEHLRAGRRRARQRPRAGRCARPSSSPACSSIYSHVPFHQEPRTSRSASARTRTARKVPRRDARADWDTCVQMAREQMRKARTCSTCASTTSAATAPSTWTRSPAGSRPRRRCRSCSTRPSRRCIEAGLQHLGGRAILNSANLEDGEGRGRAWTACMPLAREYGAAVICLHHRRGGPGPHRRVEAAGRRRGDLRHRRRAYGIEPTDLIFDALTFPLAHRAGGDPPRRDGDDRGDPRAQGRAPRRADHARAVERVVRAQARGPPRAQQRVPARVRRGRPRRRDRARGADHAADQDRRRAARGRARPHLRPRARDEATTRCSGSWRCSRTSRPRRDGDRSEELAALPVEERLQHRIIDGERDGLEADLDERARRRRHRRSTSSTTCCSTA